MRVESIGREAFYELQEPMMRFCLEVKKQRGQPIKLFVDFLRCWYTREELWQRLGMEPHVRYRENKGDKRILLELAIEERKLLEDVLNVNEPRQLSEV